MSVPIEEYVIAEILLDNSLNYGFTSNATLTSFLLLLYDNKSCTFIFHYQLKQLHKSSVNFLVDIFLS